MRRSIGYLAVCTLLLGMSASAKAQDILVPAGTLLRCTMDEPNFSSKTADIGDPVICHRFRFLRKIHECRLTLS